MTRAEKDQHRVQELIEPEMELWNAGKTLIAGADEVGRGTLAGPVMAVCVILPQEPLIPGIDDSKKVSAKKRERLAEEIKEKAIAIGIGIAEPAEIDAINILEATKNAFRRSIQNMIENLGCQPDHLFTDSTPLEMPFPVTAMVRADQNVYCVAAASILAKVIRDQMMEKYAEQYPDYGFERHKGYGTAAHRSAIIQYGASPIHRSSFLHHIDIWKEELENF